MGEERRERVASHVTPELVEVTKPGAPTAKWQQRFDAALTDVFPGAVGHRDASWRRRWVSRSGRARRSGFRRSPRRTSPPTTPILKGEEIRNGTGADDPRACGRQLAFYDQAVALDPGFRAGVGARLVGQLDPVRQQHAHARARGACPAGRGKGHCARTQPPGGVPGARRLRTAGFQDFNRALEQYEKGQRLAPGDADLLSWNGACRAGPRALGCGGGTLQAGGERLDPRSVVNLTALGDALLRLRRYPEARESLDRGLALAPANLSSDRVEGHDLPRRGGPRRCPGRAQGRAQGRRSDRARGLRGELPAISSGSSTNEQRELLLRLTPSAFDDDRGTWALCLVQAYALKRDAANVRAYAEEARKAFEEQLRAAPDNAQRHVVLGLALAYLGRKEEAIREGERAVALDPIVEGRLQRPLLSSTSWCGSTCSSASRRRRSTGSSRC